MRKLITRRTGFTLVELLVVVGILTVLTTIVLVAVNPGRQLAQARDTERRADVNTILTAITAYMADPDNNGQLPAGFNHTLFRRCPQYWYWRRQS
jgi:type IV pilus assembly protein PilA